MPLSERVKHIKPSPTLAVSARAAALKASGLDIIGLGAGEPDFDTPEHIKAAAIQAIEQGFTKYTAVEGILSLRKAIVQKFSHDNQLEFNTDQILVSCGAKQSFFNLCQALLGKGDEVIIPAPYWVSYPDIVLLADAAPVIIQAGIEQQFKITPEQLEKAITPHTKLFVINSPSNPTGIAYTRAELKALADVLVKHPNIFIATDDMYEHILWSKEPFSNILMACPALYERTIVLHGVSKTYAMTGWRIGYAAGPKDLITAMSNIQGQSTSNPCSISQMAALAALSGDQSCIQTMLKAFKERHDFVVQALNEIPGINCMPGDGTFYAFAKVQAIIDKMQSQGLTEIKGDTEFSEFLLQKAQVAVVPGSAFGAPGYVRLSFATSLNTLKEAMKRLSICIKNIN
jgi:aspartate aminotransferase